jgi:hypothetical protein
MTEEQYKAAVMAAERENPRRRKLDWNDLVGRTVTKVIERPAGQRGYDVEVVIICDDGEWMAISAERDHDDAYVTLQCPKGELTSILSPEQSFAAECINANDFAFLKKVQAEQVRAIKLRRIEALRLQVSELETKDT